MADCIDVVRTALIALAQGQVHQPLRTVVRPPQSAGVMATMAAHLAGPAPVFGLKVVTVFPDNPLRGKDAHQGVVLLVDPETGEPTALLNASAITRIRTAAASAVATDVLAAADAQRLAVIGSGVQAGAHIVAMNCVRPLQEVRLVSRDVRHAQRLAAELSGSITADIVVAESVEAALKDAEIVVTATNAATPVLQRDWLSPGAHVNAIGSSIPTTRELDSATMAAGRLFTDRRESLLNESGDYLMAVADGVIGPDDVLGELGDLLIGTVSGRITADELTIFKSLGLSVEDLAAASRVVERARETGTGMDVAFH
jgi:ornithine cyclodeaminase/alanine dehydrogenase-like protein (mu-crystallin family)